MAGFGSRYAKEPRDDFSVNLRSTDPKEIVYGLNYFSLRATYLPGLREHDANRSVCMQKLRDQRRMRPALTWEMVREWREMLTSGCEKKRVMAALIYLERPHREEYLMEAENIFYWRLHSLQTKVEACIMDLVYSGAIKAPVPYGPKTQDNDHFDLPWPDATILLQWNFKGPYGRYLLALQ